jgi:hypothetical protein
MGADPAVVDIDSIESANIFDNITKRFPKRLDEQDLRMVPRNDFFAIFPRNNPEITFAGEILASPYSQSNLTSTGFAGDPRPKIMDFFPCSKKVSMSITEGTFPSNSATSAS